MIREPFGVGNGLLAVSSRDCRGGLEAIVEEVTFKRADQLGDTLLVVSAWATDNPLASEVALEGTEDGFVSGGQSEAPLSCEVVGDLSTGPSLHLLGMPRGE